MQVANPRQYLETICTPCRTCGAAACKPCLIYGTPDAHGERLVHIGRWRAAGVRFRLCFDRVESRTENRTKKANLRERCRLIEEMGYSALDLARLERSHKPPARNPIPGRRPRTLPPGP